MNAPGQSGFWQRLHDLFFRFFMVLSLVESLCLRFLLPDAVGGARSP